MPVHNALPHLDEAVESILCQTLSEFEFVILDDASTDGSTARLREWSAKDPRIRLLEVKENLGPALSSQRVAQAALAPIVARMDADDIAYPDRLRQQFEALRENPNAGVVGCLCDIIASGGQRIRGAEPWKLIRRTPLIPFVHGATMYRQSVFSRVGGYRQECIYWEDHDLVTRMAAISDVLVIPKALVQVRQSSGSTRFNAMLNGFEQALDLMYRCLDRVARGQGYEDLLEQPISPDGKIDPRVFISLGSVSLWAGQKPDLFGRLLKRARLSADFASFSALVWTAWASTSPGTLRPFLLLLVRILNSYARHTGVGVEPLEWSRVAKLIGLGPSIGEPRGAPALAERH